MIGILLPGEKVSLRHALIIRAQSQNSWFQLSFNVEQVVCNNEVTDPGYKPTPTTAMGRWAATRAEFLLAAATGDFML